MKTTHNHVENSERYAFDFEICTTQKGWAQLDTSQDACYFGNWASPSSLKIVSYCEGDITIQTAENKEEFVEEILTMKKWNNENGHKFLGIDPGFNKKLESDFVSIGLEQLLH